MKQIVIIKSLITVSIPLYCIVLWLFIGSKCLGKVAGQAKKKETALDPEKCACGREP